MPSSSSSSPSLAPPPALHVPPAGAAAPDAHLLSAAIAHEVNNLLMVLVGNLDLLEPELPDTASARECVREMRGAVERGTALTRRVLALAPMPPLPPA